MVKLLECQKEMSDKVTEAEAYELVCHVLNRLLDIQSDMSFTTQEKLEIKHAIKEFMKGE